MWAYDSPPLLPDDTTLLLINSYLFLKDGSNDNLLRNEAAKSDDTTRNSNITVHAIGDVVLDGNGQNQTRVDAQQFQDNCGLRFYKVDGLKVVGKPTIRNPQAWGSVTEDATDITFDVKREQTNAGANRDGIDFIGPIDDLDITYSGTCDDDAIGIFAGSGWDNIIGTGGDITDVRIETGRVGTVSGAYRPVRIAAQNGGQVDNVVVDGVTITSDVAQIVSFGPNTFNGGTPPSVGDISNITIRGLRESGTNQASVLVRFNTPVVDCSIEDVRSHGTNGANIAFQVNGYTVNDLTLNGVVYSDAVSGVSANLVRTESGSVVDGLTVTNATLDNTGGGRYLLSLAGDTHDNVRVSDFEIVNADGVVSVSGTLNGEIMDGTWEVATQFTNTAPVGLRAGGDLDPMDVRDLGNVKGSRAYHDGSGTNTEGPAFNDGAGWESLVDNTAIS